MATSDDIKQRAEDTQRTAETYNIVNGNAGGTGVNLPWTNFQHALSQTTASWWQSFSVDYLDWVADVKYARYHRGGRGVCRGLHQRSQGLCD